MAESQQHYKAGRAGWQYQPLPAMEEAQFRQWQALLESRTGMTLSRERKSFLEANLTIRLRELGHSSYQAYYEAIHHGPRAVVEWATLVDRLTVQETRFFRDPDAFRLIGDFAVEYSQSRPEIRGLAAWSLGCATGEEAYSLAMVLQERLAKLPAAPYFSVTGSDISQPALNKASIGVYSARKLVALGEHYQGSYMEPDQQQGFYRVRDSLRQRLCFTRLNVMELDQAPMQGMAIILCQNLLIYFRHWRRRQIVNSLVAKLAPGGLLVLGQGELSHWQHPDMVPLKNKGVMAWIRQ
ncbi:MAG: protein-glutamate O-methyltransferase CheR [Halomonadaceae bacterium]|nr:MAG: protein-glutamate O-methyltransferase CheR [Halomonadaceae bacterium]